jgi:hypothetical protein
MKITIQPTELDIITNYPHPTVSVEIPGDDLTMDQMISDLIIPALLAYGFNMDTIKKYIQPDDFY